MFNHHSLSPGIGKIKSSLLCISILVWVSCKNKSGEADKRQFTDTVIKSLPSNSETSKYYITEDSISMETGTEETVKFDKENFNRIIDEHPEFFEISASDPELIYNCNAGEEFSSEAGQDNYFLLFAHFLKARNGVNKYTDQRAKLIKIYSSINSLFQILQNGGTYFGHQYSRIPAYAEYSVYLYSAGRDSFEKTYDIARQRDLYIQALRQLIRDEDGINFDILAHEKVQRNTDLNKIVNDLEKTITDNFYLRRAQEFHYRHYEFY